jgi:hypothetical protein
MAARRIRALLSGRKAASFDATQRARRARALARCGRQAPIARYSGEPDTALVRADVLGSGPLMEAAAVLDWSEREAPLRGTVRVRG